jgi:conjugal transfer mating pair stabilization protein TraN
MASCELLCFVCVALSATDSGAADCSTITDLYQKAQCATANMKATGALSTGSVIIQQGTVPQYGGTAGCTTAACAGAPQSGYYNTGGDVGPLNAAGDTALATDPNAARNTNMQTQASGWSVQNTAPVQSANQVSSTWVTTAQTGQTCSTTTICIEYVDAPSSPVTCTAPGTSSAVCNQNYSPALTGPDCASPPAPTSPVDTETFYDGCTLYENLVTTNQATLVSSSCTDSASKVLSCPNANGVSFLMPTYQVFLADHHPGMWYGYYQFNYGIPTPNGSGGYTLAFRVSGNATGENKYGCTNGTYGGGTWTIAEGQTVSGPGWPPYINSKCSAWGPGLSFTLGYATWTGTSFTVPFTYYFGGVASGSIQVMGGLTTSSYTVMPNTGCWQTTFQYEYTTQIPDSCATYRANTNCLETNSTCTQIDPTTGSCAIYTKTYQCSGGQVCAKTQDVTNCTSCGTPGSLVPFCTDTSTPPNTNFQIAATMVAMVQAVQNDFNKDTMLIFTGTPMSCDYSTFGKVFIDCCSTDPTQLIGNCSDEAIALAAARKAKEAHLVGEQCVEWWSVGLGKVCARKEDVYCVYKSELARMIQEQGRPQLGLNFGTPWVPICDGLTLNQFASLNFQAMDWSEFYSQIATTFDAATVSAAMKTQACLFSGSTC